MPAAASTFWLTPRVALSPDRTPPLTTVRPSAEVVVVAAVRESTDLVVQLSTGGAVTDPFDQRLAVLDAEPDADARDQRDRRERQRSCSRSGPPSQPWLEPDVGDHLRVLAERGVRHVVLAPIGFVSDHMEVVFDLDTEAVEVAEEVGIDLLRVPTVGTDTEFVLGLVDLALERAAEARGEQVEQPTWPGSEPRPSVCRPGCCPNLRVSKPAACWMD